ERRRRARLAQQRLLRVGLAHQVRREKLQRDITLQTAVARSIHDAHAAGTKTCGYLVSSSDNRGSEWHDGHEIAEACKEAFSRIGVLEQFAELQPQSIVATATLVDELSPLGTVQRAGRFEKLLHAIALILLRIRFGHRVNSRLRTNGRARGTATPAPSPSRASPSPVKFPAQPPCHQSSSRHKNGIRRCGSASGRA